MNAYAIGYIGVGAVIGLALCAQFLHERFSDSPGASLRRAFSDSAPPSNWQLAVQVLRAFLLCIFFWAPVVVWAAVSVCSKALSKRNARASKRHEPKLLVRKTMLVRRVSVDEVEAQEVVSDPAFGSPGVPFGYLSDAWSAFKGQVGPGDEIWQFELKAPPSSGESAGQDISGIGGGYALLRDGKLFAEFLTHADDRTARYAEILRMQRSRLGSSQG